MTGIRLQVYNKNSLINSGFKNFFADKFTDEDIIGNAIFLFSAGSETISSLICFCLYELALNKEIQDKLRAEIYSMKAKHGGKFNNDYLVDLHYTNMVLEGNLKFNIILK